MAPTHSSCTYVYAPLAVRMYVGDDDDKDATSPSSPAATQQSHDTRDVATTTMDEGDGNDDAAQLDTAFVRRVQRMCGGGGSSNSTAAGNAAARVSPIARWVYLAQQQEQQQQQHNDAHDNDNKAAHIAIPATRQATATTTTTAAVTSVTHTVPLPTALARRGVLPKDPLLQRLAKKRMAAATAATATSNDNSNVTAGADAHNAHWTRRRLSELTRTSWAVFCEQIGIEVEAVSTRQAHDSDAAPRGGGGARASTPATACRVRLTADMVAPIRCWEEARLPYALGRRVAQRYSLPTSIQAMCVPLACVVQRDAAAAAAIGELYDAAVGAVRCSKLDVLAVAETGSGKTAAYMVPVLADVLCHRPRLLDDEERMALGPYALILVPTRELAEQVTREAAALLRPAASLVPLVAATSANNNNSNNKHASVVHVWPDEAVELQRLSPAARVAYAQRHNLLSELRVVKVVGGEDGEAQYAELARGAHIVVGTIGQLRALLDDRLLSLGNTAVVVMDEVDRMLDAQPQREALVSVLERCPQPRQTLLYTATLTRACAALARAYLSPDGFLLVRCPHRCATIVQCFEEVADVTATMTTTAAAGSAVQQQQQPPHAPRRKARKVEHGSKSSSTTRGGDDDDDDAAARTRGLHRAVHPHKFARLVTWLAYATAPVVVFANEKRTCDALYEELLLEHAHLRELAEMYDTRTLLGPAPPVAALYNRQHNTDDASVAHASSGNGAAAAEAAVACLDNLSSIAVVHSDMSQAERTRLVQLFRSGQRRVLLTTDLLARGLDVADVQLVVNYDMPRTRTRSGGSSNNTTAAVSRTTTTTPAALDDNDALTAYVHRVGRTGRAGQSGVTVSFVVLTEELLRRVERALPTTSSSSPSTSLSATANNSGGSNSSGSEKGADAASTTSRSLLARVTAPLGSAAARARVVEQLELTCTKDELADDVVAGLWRDGLDTAAAAVDDEDDEDDDEYDEDEDDNGSGTARDEAASAAQGEHDGDASGVRRFAHDEALLAPLWSWLCRCAEANGCRDGAHALRQQTYARVRLSPALALLMSSLATRTTAYGTITQ